ncbi:MAG: hypothetical protein ACI8WB_003531, partial [Phenylobacterium sp.]
MTQRANFEQFEPSDRELSEIVRINNRLDQDKICHGLCLWREMVILRREWFATN